MKKLIPLIFLLLCFFPAAQAGSPRRDADYFHLFGGVGSLASPSSLRVGGREWEAGLLGNSVPGIIALKNLHPSFYCAYGLGYTDSVGLYAGMGAEFFKLWIVGIRFEAAAFSSINNHSEGFLTLGIDLGI